MQIFNKKTSKTIHHLQSFTLLEVIIVIIIVGILTSLALPRFFLTIQSSYSAEAFSSIQALRGSLERCYLMSSGTYSGCNFSVLDITPPDLSPNAHFEYEIFSPSASGYTIHATRKTIHGGSPSSTIDLTVTDANIIRSGTTVFTNIQ